MNGLRFDFETNDLVITKNGSFEAAEISSQNCALISLSEVCRLTKPEIGERLAFKLANRKKHHAYADIAAARRAVERDGGKNVKIYFNENEELQFYAEYD